MTSSQQNKSSNTLIPIPTTPVKRKLSVAQLQEIVEKQELIINELKNDSISKKNQMTVLENKLTIIEGKLTFSQSLNYVRDRVTEELHSQLVNLQQYTRRYSVVVSGIEKGIDEKKEVEGLLKEAASDVSFNDVDKFHRV